MRADLDRVLTLFPDAVLSGVDGAGWPVCVRCRPRYDRAEGVLRCDRAPGVDIVEGPASLLVARPRREAGPAALVAGAG